MGSVAMILRKPPYGDINAAEAVRHALGAVSADMAVSLILVDGGVLLARQGHDDTGSGLTNLETTLRDCTEMGVRILADAMSLVDHGLTKNEMPPGVEVLLASDIATAIATSDVSMIF